MTDDQSQHDPGRPPPIEDRLRAELRSRAGRAPTGGPLAEHIIRTAVEQPVDLASRRRFGWTMPLLAAAAVAAVVAGVFVAVAQLRDPTPDGTAALGSTTPAVSEFATTATDPPSSVPTGQTSGSTASSSSSTRPAPPDNPVGLNNFALTDITFYGTDDAWAIGTADCLDGSAGPCNAMVVTADGGTSWTSMKPPTIDATGIRFATPQIGYAYNDESLEMTTDGGQSWQRQDGGAVALETLDNNVIRVVQPNFGGVAHVEVADIGSSSWTNVEVPFRTSVYPFQLARSESNAYVLGQRNRAGGGNDATSELLTSSDDGSGWTNHGEPCPQVGGEVDAVSIAASPGGGLTALCRPRNVTATVAQNALVTVSDQAGAHFTLKAGTLPLDAAGSIAGDPNTVLVAAGSASYRSTDGGDSWQRITDVTGTATFVGFESPTLGRIVTDDGRTIWTTTDAGASWTSYTFPS